MRLKISNFAKIGAADIKIDGITMIAGENNTGKSTVGKILYSMFNSVYDIGRKVEEGRRKELTVRCRKILSNLPRIKESDEYSSSLRTTRAADFAAREICKKIYNEEMLFFEENKLEQVFFEITQKYGILAEKDNFEEMLKAVEIVNGTDGEPIAIEFIERFFDSVFKGQMSNLNTDGMTEIELFIQEKALSFTFDKNTCLAWRRNIDIQHEAFFIDDPFVLDNLEYPGTNWNATRAFLGNKIRASRGDEEKGIVSAVLAKEKLREITNILSNVVQGKIENNSEGWGLSFEKQSEPILFSNLSAGLKSFVLLKLLLEKNILKEKDVLILDEPEIHLHPEWQIKYAEMIVLLQKKFDLSIVVTTHSRDFFEAIELFAKKHEIINKCNFYLSKLVDESVTFEDVSEDTTPIYRHLINPGRLLDRLKFELEEEDDE